MTAIEPWNRSLRFVLTPWLAKKRNSPHIRILRLVALSFARSLILILVVLQFIDLGDADGASGSLIWLWGASLALGVPLFFVARGILTRRLKWSESREDALRNYQTRLYLLVALAEIPPLVAFVVFFTAGTLSPYLISLPISLGLIAIASPREADIRNVQDSINMRGGNVDLASILMGSGIQARGEKSGG